MAAVRDDDVEVGVYGAGPHGRQLAALYGAWLYDDNLPGYLPIRKAWGAAYLLGAAWPKTRRQLEIAAKETGKYPYLDGIVIFPGARVGDGVDIGFHSHIGWNAVVSHGCTVGSFVNVCPGAVIAGEATIGDDVFIGANATIIHGGIKIGDGAVIGAGAVVLGDVPSGVTVVGSPARIVGVAA